MKIDNQAAPLLLIDGNNLLYRAAYGFPTKIYNRSQEDITTVFAFFALLRIAFKEIGYPLCPIICFDGEHCLDARRNMFPAYKENRINNRLNPYGDLPLVMDSLRKLQLPVIMMDSLESDDLIAALSHKHKSRRRIYILSSDKDFYQLLEEEVFILNTMRKFGERLISEHHVFEKFGVLSTQWVLYRALTGDPADFIPGIRGVGPKTAVELLSLSKEDLKVVIEGRYQASWELFLSYVSIISLSATSYKPDIFWKERLIVDFETPARIVEQLGLWG